MKKLNFETFKDYAEAAMRTASDKQPLAPWVVEKGLSNNLLHALLGIVTELEEIEEALYNNDEANLFEEFGDLLWFTALAFKELNMLDEASRMLKRIYEYDIEQTTTPNDILNAIKATMFYGKEFDMDTAVHFIFQEYYKVLHHLETVSGSMDITYRELVDYILTINIAKLKKRYPNEFNDLDAVKRDLNEERKLLEDYLNKFNRLISDGSITDDEEL